MGTPSWPNPWRYRAGVNSVDGYQTAGDLRAAGFELVRQPFTWERLQHTDGAPLKWDFLDNQINQLTKNGFYILLDFHQSQWSDAFFQYAAGFPRWLYPDATPDAERGGAGVAKTAFYANEHSYGYKGSSGPWGMVGAILEACAQRYANTRSVIGLDILNEPGFGGDVKAEGSQLKLFYERMAARVAKYAPHWWLVCENGTWNNVYNGETPFKAAADWPKIGKQLVCSMHYYPNPQLRHKNESEDQAAARMLDLLANEAKVAKELGAPWYLGEMAAYGATDKGTGDNPMHWDNWDRHTAKLATWLKQNGYAWSYWAWQQGAGPHLVDNNGHLLQDVLNALKPALR